MSLRNLSTIVLPSPPSSSSSSTASFTLPASPSSTSAVTLRGSATTSDEPNQEFSPFSDTAGPANNNTSFRSTSSPTPSPTPSPLSSRHGRRPTPTLQRPKMIELQNPVAAPVGIPIKPSLPPSILDFGKRRSSSRKPSRSKDSSTTPSVAALKLLAATAIPPRPTAPKSIANGNRQAPRLPQRKNSDLSPASLEPTSSFLDFALTDALDEKFASLPITRSNSQTFLSVLLSPPDLLDDYCIANSPPRSILSIRSLSTESIPSLANDDEGTFSWGAPITPSPLRRSSKLNKTFSPPEDCALDHPLRLAESSDSEPTSEGNSDAQNVYTEQEKKLSAFSRLSFKSNLTASLRVLRSAARTFSSLSTPLTQPDDFLTRSILSITPQYNTDEKRPAFNDVPTPALRRYLNPSPKTVSRALGQFNDRNESISASIQLETYKRTITASLPEPPTPRNREVRENSDFLRVIVLEMNMRRQGKLSDTSQGKARFVLPPRQATKLRPSGRDHWNPITFD
ncbi:hypothetical protein TWF694_010550 [Orbilia ellipsospora]|uniref:Uncharacterized protein n=1 Tax=Orbilia ellipsospora TaxID=2528407 RepID=A0AAV9XDA8_9PEZI